MLKIKKTKPYQFRKLHNNSATYYNNLSSNKKSKLYISRVLCTIALICGIVPTLALLTYYNPYTESTYAARKTLSNITTMQEMTPEICANSAKYQSNTLIDARDNKSYKVTRLDDGNCWMTDNLQLTKESLTANNQPAKLDSTTSNVAEDSTFEMPDTIQTLSTESPVDFSDEIDYNNVAQIYNPGTAASNWQEGYGAYYNWYAATAGTGDADLVSTTDQNATNSICPKSWHLPTRSEYVALTKDTTPSSWDKPNKGYNFGGAFFPTSGYVKDGYIRALNTDGDYWTSTTGYNDVHGAYILGFASSKIETDNFNFRYRGFSIRCLAPASSTEFPDRFDEKDVEVIAVRVAPVISIDATSGMKEETDPNKITTGNISATISANTTYAVQLSANKTSLTNSALGVDTEITSSNSIPASTNVQAKTNAWGILNQDNSTYSAITTNPTTYYNTEEYNEESQSTKHTFGIGVSISPTLPAGEYSTTVTITAVNN